MKIPALFKNEKDRRAALYAALAILPSSLIAIMVDAASGRGIRDMVAAPLTAVFITFVGLFLGLPTWSLVWRILMATNCTGRISILIAAFVSAELVFWLLISPVWERQYSDIFCFVLVAVCGLSSGVVFGLLTQPSVDPP